MTTRPPHRFGIPEGSPLLTCHSCGAPVHWILTTRGKRMPVNPDGISHFATCPDANDWRRPR